MPKKLSLLGRSDTRLPSKPDRKVLETFLISGNAFVR